MAATKGRSVLVASMVVSSIVVASAVHAAATAEQKCQSERAKAAAAYTSCEQKANSLQNTVSQCRVKYAKTWARLRAKAGLRGTSCDAARFVDNGDGTVTDNLTGLVWETKTNMDSVPNIADAHDADNDYKWCDEVHSDCIANGTVYTDFLRSLNGECFAGQCDWRLPTRYELLTILADPSTGNACTTPSCIDAIFGPTQPFFYWSATSVAYWSAPSVAPGPDYAWAVDFHVGNLDYVPKIGRLFDGTIPCCYTRAGRGGL